MMKLKILQQKIHAKNILKFEPGYAILPTIEQQLNKNYKIDKNKFFIKFVLTIIFLLNP